VSKGNDDVETEEPSSLGTSLGETCLLPSVNGQQVLPVDGHETSRLADIRIPVGRTPDLRGGALQTRGFTPFPAIASATRMELVSASIRTMWAWWRKRSTAGVARPLGMMVSKPPGWRLLVRATLRFS
jgi:hypothetical protein